MRRYVIKSKKRRGSGGNGRAPISDDEKRAAVWAWHNAMRAGKFQLLAAKIAGHSLTSLTRWEMELFRGE